MNILSNIAAGGKLVPLDLRVTPGDILLRLSDIGNVTKQMNTIVSTIYIVRKINFSYVHDFATTQIFTLS